MTTMDYDRHCAEVADQLGLLRATLAGADLSATVPTCPDWTLGELARHTGGAVRWAERLVGTRATGVVAEDEVPDIRGPEGDDPAALDAWLAETAELAMKTLPGARADTAVWSWAEPQNAGFWARRMTHEVAIHRADAAIAAGVPYEVAADVAADAIDEWLDIVRYVQRADPEDSAAELRGAGRSIHLHATDAPAGLNAEWVIEFGEDGFSWRRGHEKATVALRGPLTEVLLAFYRRRSLDGGAVEVLGERGLLEFWLERASFG
ncbi:maleylpyruvate isomerase family mycothiol-dependent enzyme [Streptomyces sp. MZ04]|uniref:maleylpyruvate isomerase family mycothiol-dependent enzyme n=1 Tax=Streptomyces sp. MZ04 TaxID=2559236 RepID=UPI00107EC280|nr:maleylpyruvate isomerase family mycothiol-dependent enzyme [Streptomyces sp. MZ04]TGB08051.1 maleylpyruvate isomerase family mycothiol-dependent enzyme [Streptomyces sp. MZ04]